MIASTGPAIAAPGVLIAMLVLTPGVMMVLGRRDPVGVALGVLGSALVTSVAAVLTVVFQTEALPWMIASAVILYVVGAIRIFTSSRTSIGWRRSKDKPALLGALVAALPVLFVMAKAPIAWDARSIWFSHASWLAVRGNVYVDLESVGSFHPDYPPYAASLGAFAWLFADGRNDWVPLIATGVLTIAGVVLISIILSRSAVGSVWRACAGALGAIAILGAIAPQSFDGLQDGLLAVLIAAAVLMAFVEFDRQIAIVVIAAAALTKNEGLLFVLLVILPLYSIVRRSVRVVIPGLILGAAWAIAIRFFVENESWRPWRALPWSEDFIERLLVILKSASSVGGLWGGLLLWAGAMIAVFVVAMPSHVRRAVAGMGIVAAVQLTIVTATYMASPHGTQYHVDTSMNRVILPSVAVLVVAGLYGSFSALTAHSSDTVPEASSGA